MSELCTLAASVVLQSSASGAPGAEALSHPSSEAPESTLQSLDPDAQPSVGCDGHHAILPAIAPDTDTDAAIADEVEFSSSQLELGSQHPALQDPLAQALAHQVESSQDHQNSIALKGYTPGVGQPETIFPIPISRPMTTPAPTRSTTIPVGWPSLLHPSSPLAPPTSAPSTSELSPSEPSHQFALPSTSAPRLSPGLDNGLLQSPVLPLSTSRPQSGRQMYQQRWAALRAGKTYTRLPSNSFEAQWKYANYEPTHEDWLYLLSREARSMAAGQGDNALTIIVGDSLSLWMPTEFLPQHRFWLNQSVSGETAAGMVKRLYMFDRTTPDTIHVMAGINDLKNGATNAEVLGSLQSMMQQLRYRHPQAEVIIHSILPTRLPHLPSDRIRLINQQLAQIAYQEGTTFLDLGTYFSDMEGHLRQDLTTDGLHLNYRGYTMWQAAINRFR